MCKEISVITLHGMGDTNPNYYKDLENKLRKYVGKSIWDEGVHLMCLTRLQIKYPVSSMKSEPVREIRCPDCGARVYPG